MVKLQITNNMVGEPENFQWGKEWRAVRIWKELRDDGDCLFAFVIRKYGPNDYGTKKDEEMYIGREVKEVLNRDWDTNPKSKTFGQRIDVEPVKVKEEVFNEKTQRYEEQEYAIDSRLTYVYLHKASNPELVKKYKSLVGDVPGGRQTQLIMLYNSRPVTVENPKDFWDHTVEQYKNVEQKQDSIFDTENEKRAKGKTT